MEYAFFLLQKKIYYYLSKTLTHRENTKDPIFGLKIPKTFKISPD